jgi:hypothetical protein
MLAVTAQVLKIMSEIERLSFCELSLLRNLSADNIFRLPNPARDDSRIATRSKSKKKEGKPHGI